jgi:hypothetical protein
MLGMTCYPSWWLAFFYHFFNSFLVLTRGGKLHVISGRWFHIGSIRGVNHIYALTGQCRVLKLKQTCIHLLYVRIIGPRP